MKNLLLFAALISATVTLQGQPASKSMHNTSKHADPKVAANIKMYTETWDRIINEGRFELFNAEHFTEDVVMHAEPENVVGIEGMAGYYKALMSAFSDYKFTVNNIQMNPLAEFASDINFF